MNDPVKHILSVDFLRRKQKQWPLIAEENWLDFKSDHLNDLRYCNIKSSDTGPIKFGVDILHKHYPYIQSLLDTHYGKLAICGGFYSNADYMDAYSVSDIDIFFHSCSEEEASIILKSCVLSIITSYIIDNQKGRPYEFLSQNHEIKSKIQLERKLYITNVKIISYERQYNGKYNKYPLKIHTYQFIHRVYPNLGSILGGFDLGPAMVAYDGRNILATEIGAWTYTNRKMVIDISRRSTTFGIRLKKYYKRGFDIIIPGILAETVDDMRSEPKWMQLQEYMSENKIEFKCPGGHSYAYDGGDVDQHCYVGFKDHFSDEYINLMDFRIRIDKGEHDDEIKGIPFKDLKARYGSFSVRISDYGDEWTGSTYEEIADVNRTAFLHKYPESVTAIILHDDIVTSCSIDDLSNMYDRFITDPVIPFREIEMKNNTDGSNCFLERKYAEYVQYFKDEANRYNHMLYHKEKTERTLLELNNRCKNNMKPLTDNLKGLKWIVQNPDRQWTSSVNPEVVKARDFYGEHYCRIIVGIESDIETFLRIAMKTKGTVWYRMPKDIFNMIISLVIIL